MELDPDKLTNSLPDAAIQAEILKGFQQPLQPPVGPDGAPMLPTPAEGQEGAPEAAPGLSVGDMTGGGGGNIGVGAAATPGEQGFSGNLQ
jgi:hypothetical protein